MSGSRTTRRIRPSRPRSRCDFPPPLLRGRGTAKRWRGHRPLPPPFARPPPRKNGGGRRQVENPVDHLDDLAGVLVDQERVVAVAHPDRAFRRIGEVEVPIVRNPVILAEEQRRQEIAVVPAAVIPAMRTTIGPVSIVTRRIEGAAELVERAVVAGMTVVKAAIAVAMAADAEDDRRVVVAMIAAAAAIAMTAA